MGWLFVPELEDLSSDSTSLSGSSIELYVTLSGKPTQRPLSWRGWKTRPWIRLLYGTILRPSTADRGAESWILSLQATRVSHSQSRASEKAKQTNGISGMTLPELSERFPPHLYSSKTLPEQLSFDLDVGNNWRAWATELRRDYSQRRKWAHRTRGSGCFSLRDWMTPKAGQCGETGICSDRPPEMSTNLKRQAGQWRTPKADVEHHGPNQHDSMGAPHLPNQVANWATPDLMPEAPNKGANVKCREASLGLQTANWPTPAHHEPRLGNQNRSPGARGTQESLTTHASRFSLQDQPTSTPGEKSLQNDRKLNPLFVEWLMGWPIGMTDCERAEMVSYRKLPHSLLSLSATDCREKDDVEEHMRWLRLSRSLLFGGD